eukprot:1703817-Rhodomonas_salina.5
MSGTNIAATLHACYAVSGTDICCYQGPEHPLLNYGRVISARYWSPISLCRPYVVSGTQIHIDYYGPATLLRHGC